MPSIQGFDTGSYPGDDAITAWSNGNSPFQFMGFYFDAPAHTTANFTTYSGKRAFLQGLGWGLIVIYVGRQVGSSHLTTSYGTQDGNDAIAKGRAEGFKEGTLIFLDVEPYDGDLPSNMATYITTWFQTLLADGNYVPAMYCHRKNVDDIQPVVQQCFTNAGNDTTPSFWITGGPDDIDPDTSVPSDSGVSFADVWQWNSASPEATYNDVTLSIDYNIANSANPSNA